MKKICNVILVLQVLILSSCDQQFKAPYVLIGPECLIESTEGYFEYAGVFATLYNSSDKDIASLELSFDVFDRVTKKSPFYGSNHITAGFNELIYADEKAELCVSLDAYLHVTPLEPYIINNFCVNSITYTDGSRWTDYLCVNSASSN